MTSLNNILGSANTTICAPATPAGGAIGIIRVSGLQAIQIANSIFSRDILSAKGYSMHYGTIMDEESSNDCIDDVILTLCRAPHSYTGEDTIEISHHGSAYIQQQILNILIKHGCQMAKPGEYTQRAFLNGKMDLSQAEAVADLIASNNRASHRIAMNQMRGGITSKLSELRDGLLKLTSLLELELDFSEEDVEFADRTQLLSIATQVEQEISRLTNSFSTGNAIKNGIPVAIIGAPNVGKSTLLNQLLNDDKAIVSDIEGTTRDTIEDTITIGGVLFRFIDTAGIRDTSDKIENLGIERSLKAADRALIIILMRDDVNDYPEINTSPEQHVIRVFNKSIDFQAINGTGLDWLHNELLSCVPHTDNDQVIITNLRHKQALELALHDIRQSIRSMHSGLTGDLIAEDLRQCLSHLNEILGNNAILPESILQNIFHSFCIGK